MKTRVFLLFVCVTLFACGLFTPSPPVTQDSSNPLTDFLSASKPGATEEAAPTSTSVPEVILLDSAGDEITTVGTLPRQNFLPPSIEPSVPLPPLADLLPLPEGTVNVLLLGSDQRGPFDGIRTDTILLVSFHPKRGQVSMISFPRDLYVYVPGWTVRRINEAYQHGGFELLADTFDYNFGIHPEHFVLVDFNAFQTAVDKLGGLEVQVGKALSEGDYSVKPGLIHMDGEMALWYVRSRYTSSDFERMTRQQEVLVAMFQRLISLDALKKVPQMYSVYEESVTTNIALHDTLTWAGVAGRIVDDTENLQSMTINRDFVTPFRTPAGAQVLLPDQEAIWQALNEMLIK